MRQSAMYVVIDTGSGQGSNLAHRGDLMSAVNKAKQIAPANGRAVEVWNPETQVIVFRAEPDGTSSFYPRR